MLDGVGYVCHEPVRVAALEGDVEEVVTSTEVDEETYEEIIKTSKRQIDMLLP